MQVFVSYSRGTPYVAESIKALLESKNFAVWLDLDDIVAGSIWERKIFESVEKSFLVIVIVTKQAIGSEWIKREIEAAKQQNREIIPLIMERIDDVSINLKHLGVEEYQYIDFVNQRKKDAEDQLLTATENSYKSWSGIIPFIQKLKSDSKVEQIFGIRQIGKVSENTKASSYLFPFLKSEDWEMRSKAVEALASIADETAIEPLIELIREGSNNPDYSRLC